MNLFQFIKSHISIIDVIDEYTTLKKAGLYWKGLCPFHHEKTASFTVSPHKEIFYCFGCHSGGDAIAFITKIQQCSPLEATQYLADRFKIEIPQEFKQISETSEVRDARTAYAKLCSLFADWCHDQLLKSKQPLSYLEKRGFTLKTVDSFKIGFFPLHESSIKKLLQFAKSHNFLLSDLIEFNLLIEAKNQIYSPFGDRIIFPIKDHLGNFCGFGGRTFKAEDERPKYYNSKDQTYFSKGSVLFGLDLAKKQIQQIGSAFLVEGYMDCLAMVQHGYKNTVASLGTACTNEQLRLLARYTQEVIVMYDGDEAGKKAMLRLAELCWQVNLELKIIQLPANTDPAAYFQTENNNFKQLMEHPKDIFIYCIDQMSRNFQSKKLLNKLETIRNLVAIIDKLEDPLKRDLLLQKTAQTFDVPLELLKQELENSKPGENKRLEPKIDTISPAIDSALKEITILEKKLFSVIINNVTLLSADDKLYLLEYLSHPLQELLKKLIESNRTKGDEASIEFWHFFDALSSVEKQIVTQLVIETQDFSTNDQFEYLLNQFQRKNWKSFVSNTKIKLLRAQQTGNKEEETTILLNFQELKKKLIIKGLI